MSGPTIRLDLTVAEVNAVLGALGNLPYRDVYALIERIHAQAGAQLDAGPAGGTDQPAERRSPS